MFDKNGSSTLEIFNIGKKYKNRPVLRNVSLNVRRGEAVGLLGPNGSGKTTLIKMLVGLLQPEKGSIRICGHEVGPESKAVVSYLPERTYLSGWMNVVQLKIRQLVNMFKDFYADFDETRAYDMMKLLNIDPDMTLKKLSKGNKEKVQLIMVMSRRARLYVLDEPIAGVDPAARDYIMQTILTNYDEKATILLSTHLISDIENILDEVIFIKEGEIICQKDADALRAEKGQSIDEIFREVFRC